MLTEREPSGSASVTPIHMIAATAGSDPSQPVASGVRPTQAAMRTSALDSSTSRPVTASHGGPPATTSTTSSRPEEDTTLTGTRRFRLPGTGLVTLGVGPGGPDVSGIGAGRSVVPVGGMLGSGGDAVTSVIDVAPPVLPDPGETSVPPVPHDVIRSAAVSSTVLVNGIPR